MRRFEPVRAPFHEAGLYAAVADALEDVRSGKFVVVVDARDREGEGEGDLIIAAECKA